MNLSNIRFMSRNELVASLAHSRFSLPVILINRQKADLWGFSLALTGLVRANRAIWLDEIKPLPTQESVWVSLQRLGAATVHDRHFGSGDALVASDHPDSDSVSGSSSGSGVDPATFIDGIIAIGGGSVIDHAKTISALYRGHHHNQESLVASSDDLLDYIQKKSYLHREDAPLPIIAVPTTAGTGSEVTQWATIWDSALPKKHSIEASYLLPEEVWIVPELTHTLPPKLTLSTGLDAVCHAAEAYWAKPSTPLVKELSIRSLQLITENLHAAMESPNDPIPRKNMVVGALLAGLAFGQTRTTACHSISYPLTSMYQVDHGFACALTLAQVAEINAGTVDLSSLFGVFAPYGGLRQWLDYVCVDIVKLRLSDFGITESEIDSIVDHAFTGGRMDNNPVDLSRQDVKAILEGIIK